MSDPLSQDMIDALLSGVSQPSPPSLSSGDIDGLKKLSSICMDAGVSTLLILLNIPVSLPLISINQVSEFECDPSQPLVMVHLPATIADKLADHYFLLTPQITSAITDLMMGGEGKNLDTPVDDLQLSAVSEAINQMMGSAITSVTSFFSKRMEIAPPAASLIDLPDGLPFPGPMVRFDFEMNIEGICSGPFVQFLSLEAAQNLAVELFKKPAKPAPEAEKTARVPVSEPAPQPVASAPKAPPPEVRSAQFAPLVSSMPPLAPSGLDLILDVPLKVTVELGRTKMQVRHILELSKGSLVELDKLAGEPVDLFVNGKLIARGEVVVIEENFGVRVTDIVSPVDRVKSLKG
ncbi:MAG TPA: flagellar motor switch phosphatase FliY [Cyanobacteria bacterium UBA8530]|nr:flagellar motor switch phosphatase FliY [Cyanobacteria bacterium UBA8530]